MSARSRRRNGTYPPALMIPLMLALLLLRRRSKRRVYVAAWLEGPARARLTVAPVRLGDVANAGAQGFGKPLDGVRVLAAEQMQALPYATQMLARLGADVVKVEHPEHGESARASTSAMLDPHGRTGAATYLRHRS